MTEPLNCPFCGAVPRETSTEYRVYHRHGCWFASTTLLTKLGTKEWNTRPARLTDEDRKALEMGARELDASASYSYEPFKAEMAEYAARLRALAQQGGAR